MVREAYETSSRVPSADGCKQAGPSPNLKAIQVVVTGRFRSKNVRVGALVSLDSEVGPHTGCHLPLLTGFIPS